MDSIPAPGGELRGLVFANDTLYANDKDIDSVFKYDPGTQTWSAVFATPIPPGATGNQFATGMTFDGMNFWIANSSLEYDYLFQMSRQGTVLRTYPMPQQGDAQWTGIVFTQD